jgi:hypothetical protein
MSSENGMSSARGVGEEYRHKRRFRQRAKFSTKNGATWEPQMRCKKPKASRFADENEANEAKGLDQLKTFQLPAVQIFPSS